MKFIVVGLGGAVGAVLRYAVSLIPYKNTFPLLTLLTNISGAILIGFVVGIAVRKNLSENGVLFLKTGICGGYTTFSTFSLEAYQLFQNGSNMIGVLYIIFSVAGCLLGIWLGEFLARTAA